MTTPHRNAPQARLQAARRPVDTAKPAAARTPAGSEGQRVAEAALRLPPWARPRADGAGITLTLHVQPGARASGAVGRHGDALKLRIAAPATDNKANAALIEFMHRSLGVPRDAVHIAQGRSTRRKVVEIAAAPAALAARLAEWDLGAEE